MYGDRFEEPENPSKTEREKVEYIRSESNYTSGYLRSSSTPWFTSK